MRILTSVQGENWYNQGRMRDLKSLREGWDEVARQERRSAEHLTIAQSVSIYLALCRDMAPRMRETEEIFRRDREAYLAELQSRLRRLNDLRRQQHGNHPNLVKSAALAQLALNDAGIDSIVIGGLAVAIWGELALHETLT
jgi:hypothetical protein